MSVLWKQCVWVADVYKKTTPKSGLMLEYIFLGELLFLDATDRVAIHTHAAIVHIDSSIVDIKATGPVSTRTR